MLNSNELPPCVIRSKDIDLDTCHAIQLHLEPHTDGAASSAIIGKDGPKYTRPVDQTKRNRDLRPGDTVVFKERTFTIRNIEIYR